MGAGLMPGSPAASPGSVTQPPKGVRTGDGGRPRASRTPDREEGLVFQIKKLCRLTDKNPACVVYEDMSCGNRNTVSIPNVYQ